MLPWTRSQHRSRRHHRAGAERGWAYGNAFVCSGGGNLGAAQVGMLRVLLGAGILPDLLVGCSVGALNAAYLAVDPRADRVAGLEGVWRSIGTSDVFNGTRRSVAGHVLRKQNHLYEPDGLRALIARAVPLRDLGETAVPVQVVTTDLRTGRTAWWATGNPVDVLAASACLPGMFPPVALGGSLHVDGGVLDPVPAARALALGAETVWVLDVGGNRLPALGPRASALDVLLASFAIARRALAADLDEVRRPGQQVVMMSLDAPPHLAVRDFSRTSELIRAGEAAAARALRGRGAHTDRPVVGLAAGHGSGARRAPRRRAQARVGPADRPGSPLP